MRQLSSGQSGQPFGLLGWLRIVLLWLDGEEHPLRGRSSVVSDPVPVRPARRTDVVTMPAKIGRCLLYAFGLVVAALRRRLSVATSFVLAALGALHVDAFGTSALLQSSTSHRPAKATDFTARIATRSKPTSVRKPRRPSQDLVAATTSQALRPQQPQPCRVVVRFRLPGNRHADQLTKNGGWPKTKNLSA